MEEEVGVGEGKGGRETEEIGGGGEYEDEKRDSGQRAAEYRECLGGWGVAQRWCWCPGEEKACPALKSRSNLRGGIR